MTKLSEELAIEDGLYDTEIEDDDYGIILGPNGELKSVFLHAMDSNKKEEIRMLARQSIIERFSIEKRGEALYKIINTLVK